MTILLCGFASRTPDWGDGLAPNDDQDTHVRIQMQKLEEMVYGDFFTVIRKRLDAVKAMADPTP